MISSNRILCLLVFSIASILHHVRIVSSFNISPIRSQLYAMKSGFIISRAYRHTTKLKNDKLYQDDDFASFNDYQNEGGVDLAAQFYQELEYRDIANDDTSKDRSTEDERDTTNMRSIRRTSNDSASAERRRRIVSSQKQSTSNESLLEFLFSLFAPSQPPQSAGLFSGTGTTVYSTRSIQAEIQILESTIKNNEENEKLEMDKEQLEVRVRSVLISLIVLSAAYIALETGDLDSVGTLMNDISEGLSSIMISDGEPLLGDAASELATSLVDAVKSIETFALL